MTRGDQVKSIQNSKGDRVAWLPLYRACRPVQFLYDAKIGRFQMSSPDHCPLLILWLTKGMKYKLLVALTVLCVCCQESAPYGSVDPKPWAAVEVTQNNIKLRRYEEYQEVKLCGVELAPTAPDKVRSLLDEREGFVWVDFVSDEVAEIWIEYGANQDLELLNGLIVYLGLGKAKNDQCPNQTAIDGAERLPKTEVEN